MARFRSFILVAAGWAFIGMPALCTGGILTHPCDCRHSQEADHGEKGGCGHETECESDPCGVVVIRPQDGNDAGQWLCDTLTDAHPFAAVLFNSDQSKALAFLAASSPPSVFPCDLLAQPTATTVLLI